jgi:hypothetical protein
VFRGIGFPDQLTTNLIYSESFVLTPTALNPTPFKTYRMTSVFDPDEALGGRQPTYFDQVALIYDRYIVNGAKITVGFARGTNVNAGVGPFISGIQQSFDQSIPSTSADVLLCAPNTTSVFHSVDDGTKYCTGQYNKNKTFTATEGDLQSRTNGNPFTNWYAKVWTTNQGSTLSLPVNVLVTIEYNVTFSTMRQIVDA